MKPYINILYVSILVIMLAACSSTEKVIDKTIDSSPSWFLNVPQDDNFLFAAVTTTSRDMQMAIRTAQMDGRSQISEQLELRMQGIQTRFQEEVGVGMDAQILQQFSSAYKSVVEETLRGSRARHQLTQREGVLFRAYVLMEMPIGAASEALAQRIRNNENMYTRFRATQAFKDLEKEVEDYRAWRETQN